MWKWAFLVPCLAMSACATSFSTLDKALPRLKGHEISEAVRYLGVPSHEYETVGRRVYVWSTTDVNPFSGTTTNSRGRIGGTPFTATSQTTGGPSERLTCTLRIVTLNGVIEDYDYTGNNGACFRYSDRLEPLVQR